MIYKPMGNMSLVGLALMAERENCDLKRIETGQTILKGDWWSFGNSFTQIQTDNMGIVESDMIILRFVENVSN